MADDYCRPHGHYGNAPSMTCHHFYYQDGVWKCMCGARRQSVVNRDVARKYKDRIPQ